VDPAGRPAGIGVKLRRAPRQVFVAGFDPEHGHRPIVEPGGMAVVADQEDGSVPGHAMQHVGGRPPAGDGPVAPALALDPRQLRTLGNERGDASTDLRERGRSAELDRVRVRSQSDVVVGIDEAGEHRPTAGIQHLGPGARPRGNVSHLADECDAVTDDRNGLRDGARIVHGVHPCVADDQIGMVPETHAGIVRPASSGADDDRTAEARLDDHRGRPRGGGGVPSP
jgi:hypothetical protein